MLDKLKSDNFAFYLHQNFRVHLDGVEPINLELVRVTEAGTTSGQDARNPFSLHFLGPVSEQYLIQHIHRLEHGQMGNLEIFLVPLGFEDGRMRYEAIFT